jgi:hypothetical protein
MRILVWAVLFLAVFLLGFVPQYRQNRELRSQLEQSQKNTDALNVQFQLAQVRDAANLMMFEIFRQNYGLARDHAAKYYAKLKETADMVQDPALKKSLEELVATRDSTTAELAMPNPASAAALQPIVMKTIEVTKR